MKNFIEYLAKEIQKNHNGNFKNVCVVFPSRRAGVYFKDELRKLISAPAWSPEVISINDFIEKFSGNNIADNITLIFSLYEVYKKLSPEESFDDFYNWGEMILKDFDTLDKYMVDAKKLFKQIKDEKEIDANFPLEEKEYLLQFWQSILKDTGDNKYKDIFLETWDNLYKIYKDYNILLDSKKITYEGKAVRYFANNIENLNFDYDKIYFAGFNSLNSCEKIIFSYLSQSGLANVYWDSDKYYFEDIDNEAGKFLRKNSQALPTSVNIMQESLLNDAKTITVTSASSEVGMTKALGIRLSEFINNNEYDIHKTLIVVPDRKLLIPLLYSIPDEVKSINVTMGLPFNSTPLNDLIELLKAMHFNKIIEKGKVKYYHSDLIKFLLHPYIKFISVSEIYSFVNTIRDANISYAEPQQMFVKNIKNPQSKEFFKNLFYGYSTTNELISYLKQIFNFLSARTSNAASDLNHNLFQLEYLIYFAQTLDKICDATAENNIELSTLTFWQILTDILASSNCVFTGEPLSGLQIMGLLETRNLCFENIFVLSVNENILPSSSSSNTYIPYNLRKAFQMPTFEDNDAVNSYYFYSLLQKAKNIFLFYNTEINMYSKEKSRYIRQIENELIVKNKNIKYIKKSFHLPFEIEKEKPIVIKKTTGLNEFIKNKVLRLSATDINMYINCPLQFYFSKISSLVGENEIEEVLSPMTFGTVFHSIMEKLYKPYLNKTITPQILNNIIKNTNVNFDTLFNEVIQSEERFKSMNFEQKGRNSLYKSIIKKLVFRVLKSDLQRCDFKILEIEKKIIYDFQIDDIKIVLKGIIDRVDNENGVIKIIDYKTGDAGLLELKDNKDNEENINKIVFDEIFSNPDRKASLQTLLYAYIYKKLSGKDDIRINTGLYSLKDINKKGLKVIKNTELSKNDFEEFEQRLISLIREIFTGSQDIIQTEEKYCVYCDFKDFCGR